MPIRSKKTDKSAKRGSIKSRTVAAARRRPPSVKHAVAKPKSRVKHSAPARVVKVSWWHRLREKVRTQPELLWLGVVLVAALVLRWLRPDWYAVRQFHPDERWIFGVVSQLSYPEAPIGLQYGTFPLYLLSTLKDFVMFITGFFGRIDPNQFVIWAGRMLSGLFDVGTVIVTYMLGTRILPEAQGRRLGLLAALLLTFSVLNIQMAHFFVVDVPLALLVMATLYAAVGIAQTGRRRDYLLAGVCLGLAMATKTSALPVSLAVGAAHVLGLAKAKEADRPRRWLELGLAVVASGVAFFIAMPHAIIDWSRFWSNQNEQRRILVTGEADVPYNRQYLHTMPFLYYGKNLILYTLGWPLGLLSMIAFMGYPLRGLWIAGQAVARRTADEFWERAQKEIVLILALVFGVAYALVIGTSFAKFNRYCLPLTPVFCLAGARLLFAWWEHARTEWMRRLVKLTGGLVAISAILWSLAFVSIYQAEHPWVAASRWLLAHASEYSVDAFGFPHQTAILNEEWGDDLPVYVEKVPAKPYRINKFSVQEPDTPQKRANILNMLQSNDWIAVADTRAHAVYRRLPDRYPINAAYYELLFANQLGYHLAAEFKNYPRLFGLEFPDDRADESFTLYDHPHVYLFKRNEVRLSPMELAQRLDAGIVRIQKQVPVAPLAPVMRQGKPAVAKPVKELPTVVNKNIGQSQARPFFILGSLNSFTAGLAWLLLLELMGLVAIPLCLHVFPKLPDAGVALAKIVGTLVFGWTVWMLVSLGAVQHTQGASAVIFILFATVSGVWVSRHPEAWKRFIRDHGRDWVWAEVIFAVAFVGYMLTKLYNPDIHNPFGQGYNGGGEPMGMTFFSGVYKSIHFPPYDAWLSGYHINYYYYGHVILGILAKLIGAPPAWSYNIVIALMFALTVTGLYGLGYALTGKRGWGVMAAVAGAMLGNLHSLFYLLEPLNRGTIFTDGLNGITSWWHETWRHANRFEFLWNPTRLIKGTINEMPWFSFLYGDLHAHIIAIPYSLPLIGWGLSVLLQDPKPTDRFPDAPGNTKWERGWSWFLAALTLGALSAINTWNFPPYALLVLGVLVARTFRNQAQPKWALRPLWDACVAWLRIVLGGLLLLFFFHRYFIPNSTSLAFVNPEVRTTLKDFMVFFGLAIFAVSSFWAQEILPALLAWWRGLAGKPRARETGWSVLLKGLQTLWRQHPGLIYAGGTILLGIIVLMIFNQLLLTVLTIMLLMGAYVLVARPLNPQAMMTMLLAELGFAVVWGCEWVHVKDFMGTGGDMSRMNTVFKFYMVVWILFALVIASGLHRVLSRPAGEIPALPARGVRKSAKKVRVEPPAWVTVWEPQNRGKLFAGAAGLLVLWMVCNYYQVNTEWPWLTLVLFAGLMAVPWLYAAQPKRWAWVWSACLITTVGVVALYPPLSLYNRMRLCSEFKHPTLNGEAYLDRMNPQDAKALAWINENITRTDVVLEAPGPQGYNCFDTRVAIFTGQPTLIGWIGEEEQMRYNNELTGARVRDAAQIFGTPDILYAKTLMEKYRVAYVYVGGNEKKAFPLTGLEKFRNFMDVVYDLDGVAIYKVRP
jgi:YYY domain-containing protein